jgi:hypothetical protein
MPQQRHFYAEWTTTPLGFACFFGGEHLVEFLLRHDADPEIRNTRGHTAFQLARGHSVLTLVFFGDHLVEALVSQGKKERYQFNGL